MAVTPIVKLLPNLLEKDSGHFGKGQIFLGTVNSDYSEPDLMTMGALYGKVDIKPTSTFKDLEAGSPNVTVRTEISKVGFDIDVTFLEVFNPDIVLKVLGYGSVSNVAANPTASVTDEKVKIYTNFWYNLLYNNINPGSVVVTTNAVTPVPLVENTDYLIEYTNGAIQKITTGAIADKDTVLVSYTHNAPEKNMISFGSNTLNYYPLKFFGTGFQGKRFEVVFPKVAAVGTPTISYSDENWTEMTQTFRAWYDQTQLPDRAFGWFAWE